MSILASSGIDWHDPTEALSWRRDAATADLFAILLLDTGHGPAEDRGHMVADMMLEIRGMLGPRVLTERPSAKTCYVIYWPGVLEIPWPEGLTAQQAIADWKDGLRAVIGDEPIDESITDTDIKKYIEQTAQHVAMLFFPYNVRDRAAIRMRVQKLLRCKDEPTWPVPPWNNQSEPRRTFHIEAQP